MSLLFANQTEEDILCRTEIEAMAAANPRLKARRSASRFSSPQLKLPRRLRLRGGAERRAPSSHPAPQVWYTVDRPPASGWKYGKGFITKEMIADHLPAAGPSTQVLICGPPPMIKFACRPALSELGFTEDNLLVW